MNTINLSNFLAKATEYEDWRAQLDPRLRQLTQLSGLSIVCMTVALYLLLPIMGEYAFLSGLQAFLIGLHMAALAVYLVLFIATNGLETGRTPWHWVATGEVVLGAIDAFMLGLIIAGFVIIAIFWLIAIVIAIVVLLIALSQVI